MSRFIIASAAAFETDDAIRRLQDKGVPLTRVVTGVGMTESSMIAARTRELVIDRDIIFCCTAGIIGDFRAVELFSASRVMLRPWDVRNHKTELLEAFDPSLSLLPLSFPLPQCDAYCALGVTVVPEETESPMSPQPVMASLETMELYAVARAWLPLVRSFTAVVAVTNGTGERARFDWRSNYINAAKITGSFLEGALPQVNSVGDKYV